MRVPQFTLGRLLKAEALFAVAVCLVFALDKWIVRPTCCGVGRRQGLTSVQMITITQVLDSFKLDHERYPEALQDLIVAPNYVKPERYQQGGYLKEVPTDGWGNEFIYRRVTGVKGFELISYGADNREGGEGYDKDILK